MGLVVQLAGSAAILTAFLLAQLGLLDGRSLRYLALNLAGSAVLTVDAYLGAEWGFFALEAVWAVASAVGLLQLLRGRRPSPAH
jgi:hypothetical protein